MDGDTIRYVCRFKNTIFTIWIKDPETEFDPPEDYHKSYTILVYSSTLYKEVFGHTMGEYYSILVQVSDTKYVYVGKTIFSFECSEKVVDYVPSFDGMCYLVTEESIYFYKRRNM